MSKEIGFGTRAVHAGQTPDPQTGAVMTPIYFTSTYAQRSPGDFIEPYDYGRTANPTRAALQQNIAALEGGKFGLCYSSGCAALDCVLHLLSAGDHVVLCDDIYGGTFRLFDKVFTRHGITFTLVDMSDLKATAAAFTSKTKLTWIETPTNPLLKVIDIERVAEIARNHAALSVVDNTFASPYLQNPLSLGADIVCHSETKYISGHSDVIGGALVVNDAQLEERLRFLQNAVGAVPSPMDCFMLLRSTKTLHVRMERHCQNAEQIVKFLGQHAAIEKVYYPGLETHPQHAVARRQMRRFGGMVSAVVKGGLPAAKRVLEKTKVFTLAESLGGVESLIELPAVMTHASIPAAQRAKLGISDGLIRLSVGIEDVDDLLADLEQALH